MPAGAVYVGRPSRWGNPWKAGELGPRVSGSAAGDREWYLDRELAVRAFARLTVPERLAQNPAWLEPLRGRDLVCWCLLSVLCHADVLLQLANRPAAVVRLPLAQAGAPGPRCPGRRGPG